MGIYIREEGKETRRKLGSPIGSRRGPDRVNEGNFGCKFVLRARHNDDSIWDSI